MSDNPFVADAPENRGLFTNSDVVNDQSNSVDITNGIPVVDASADAAVAFSRGDWVEGSLLGVTASLDVVGAVLDPFGTLGTLVAGWIIEHLGPAQDFLDQLAGNPDEILAESQTWQNVARGLREVAASIQADTLAQAGHMDGEFAIAMKAFASAQSAMIGAMAGIADAVGVGINLGGTIVAGVRDFIQWLISTVIGTIIGAVTESLVTVGIAAPHALTMAANKCRQAITEAADMMTKLSRTMNDMGSQMSSLTGNIDELGRLVNTGVDGLRSLNVSQLVTLGSATLPVVTSPSKTEDKDPYF